MRSFLVIIFLSLALRIEGVEQRVLQGANVFTNVAINRSHDAGHEAKMFWTRVGLLGAFPAFLVLGIASFCLLGICAVELPCIPWRPFVSERTKLLRALHVHRRRYERGPNPRNPNTVKAIRLKKRGKERRSEAANSAEVLKSTRELRESRSQEPLGGGSKPLSPSRVV